MARQDPARVALREAIAAIATLDAEIKDSAAAVERAREGRFEARRNLDRLSRAAEPALDVERFVDAVRAGGELDVAALAPERTKQAELAGLATAAERWDLLLAATTESLDELRSRRERATWRRDAAVNEVIKQSGVARTLLDGLAELQAAVLARRYILSKLVSGRLVSDDEASAIREALRGLQRLPTPDFTLVEWAETGAGRRWHAAVAALAANADAALPTLAELLAAD
jgi:hypothetical protein